MRKINKRKMGTFILLVIIAITIIAFVTFKKTEEMTTNDKDYFQAQSIEEFKEVEEVVLENKDDSMEDDFVYIKEIPMPLEHQEFLYNKSKQLSLSYEKLLAIIATESSFDSTIISTTNDYGYFQINKVNHENFAAKYETENRPLNPIVNLEWGTNMLSDLYEYWSEKGIEERELDHYVWSSYNKGLAGFKKYGYANYYISNIENNLSEIENLLKKAVK